MNWWDMFVIGILVLSGIEQFNSMRILRNSRKILEQSRAMQDHCAWAVADNQRLRLMLQQHGINPGPADELAQLTQAELVARMN